eukprot:TRINITY_DN6251_c0_g1_i1.p1 TRINITY_DN6251_c0_g1~~TRINITY_DN6251_c0_g1_i1.p1  ORF type:complete len:510 (+),score=123.57 TRINITY_DN6251_c0_g1_i1:28-1557(+)
MKLSLAFVFAFVLLLADYSFVLAAIPNVRPVLAKRKFTSVAVNALIDNYVGRMKDKDLATLFNNAYPNTLDTTVEHFTSGDNPDAFIITGDITAQWLRDSTNQILPYVSLTNQDKPLRQLVCGLMHRQWTDVLHDPYANAFNYKEEGGDHQWDNRKPKMTPHVFEGKYELDSLAAVLKLAYGYYNSTSDHECFTKSPTNFVQAMSTLVSTIRTMQSGTKWSTEEPYTFQRTTSAPTDSLMLGGMGSPAKQTGMSRSPFRPSDDSTTMQFLVPANAMAIVELRHLATILLALSPSLSVSLSHAPLSPSLSLSRLPLPLPSKSAVVVTPSDLAKDAIQLAQEIDTGLQTYARVSLSSSSAGQDILAYEVDGFGGRNLMDDANIPSLLSLPYLGYLSKSDPLYLRTRAFVWSMQNPYYFEGAAGKGIGGPHVGIGWIWPMSIIMRALTSSDDGEIMECLSILKGCAEKAGLMHESFWKDDSTKFTRSWFAWANTLFGELIITIAKERPHLIF